MSGAKKTVDDLAAEMLDLLGDRQVKAFLAEGEYFADRDQFFDRLRYRMANGLAAIEQMRVFLKRHRELSA